MSPRRLPVVSGAQVVRALEKDGFEVISTKGSHWKLRRGPKTVIVPLHNELATGTLASALTGRQPTTRRPRS
jgi:predicted RNA binding protein YcfA (HicA-like mRNA interferase family)